jgi:[ribosomal protein S5]-alanine N-acetyltransferase
MKNVILYKLSTFQPLSTIMQQNLNISYRPQQLNDAQAFMDILNHPDFIYFPVKVQSLESEINYLQTVQLKTAQGISYDFSILNDNKVIGAVGIKIDQHRKYIGEIGYFVAREFWSRGIACQAVRWAEQWAIETLKLSRIAILMQPENRASEIVAIKNGYLLEGLMRKAIFTADLSLVDAYLYAKTF